MKKLYYFPIISWVIVLFIIWYIIVISGIVKKYYKVMRSRVMYDRYLYYEINNSLSSTKARGYLL
jgi:hypothetical protein